MTPSTKAMSVVMGYLVYKHMLYFQYMNANDSVLGANSAALRTGNGLIDTVTKRIIKL